MQVLQHCVAQHALLQFDLRHFDYLGTQLQQSVNK
jgi:hypothetical protein